LKLGVIASKGSSAYTELGRIAQSSGHDVEAIAADAPDAASRIEKLIETADALIVASPIVFAEKKPEWQRRIHLRIASDGLRLLFIASPQELGLQNGFLFFYGIQVEAGPVLADSPIMVRRSPHSFRDPSLFAGVESIELCDPMVLDIRADTLPVLVLSGVSIPENESAKPVVAVWHALEGGAVLVAGTTLIADRRRLGASDCAGIAVNARFAHNLVRFLLPAGAHPVVPVAGPAPVATEPSAEELITRTERNLSDLVIGILEKTSAEWWYDCVPENIRLEAVRAYEQERGRFPKHAYLYLIQFREIIQANFVTFEPLLKSVGWTGGKANATAWLVKLNEHRKLSAHPLKAHVGGHVFSDEDLAFLRDVDVRVSAMLKKASSEEH
jgi:hypothetical protein